jgi:hypothetical protein
MFDAKQAFFPSVSWREEISFNGMMMKMAESTVRR